MLIKVITSRKSLFHSIALALALIQNCLSLLLPGFDKHIYFRSIYHPFCECTTHSVTRCCYSNKSVFPLQSSTECQVSTILDWKSVKIGKMIRKKDIVPLWFIFLSQQPLTLTPSQPFFILGFCGMMSFCNLPP